MKVELGRTYLTRNGLRVSIDFDDHETEYPMRGFVESIGDHMWWSRDGEIISGPAQYNLVSRCARP